jgi:hypothetical protein
MEGDWGYDVVRGVFSSRAAAAECVAECQSRSITAGVNIEEWKLDGEKVFA